MTLPGRNRDAPKVIVGSHLDSVPNGGNYDGAAGVVAGLLAVNTFKKLGIRPECDVTVMAIRAEESIWFQVSYIGSRAALGMLPKVALDAKRFDTGRPLFEHLAECGGDPRAIDEGELRRSIRNGSGRSSNCISSRRRRLVEAGKPIGVRHLYSRQFPLSSHVAFTAATIMSVRRAAFVTMRSLPAAS